MSNDTFLPLPDKFAGRVAVRPNGTNSVVVDGQSNSANGNDDDPRVCFITYRGKDYTHSSNWHRNDDGVWFPVSYEVHQRGSFGMARAPKTYAAAIITMIADGLAAWYEANDGGAAMRRAEVQQAQRSAELAADKVVDARAAYEAALEAQRAAEARLTKAQLATITLHAPQA